MAINVCYHDDYLGLQLQILDDDQLLLPASRLPKARKGVVDLRKA